MGHPTPRPMTLGLRLGMERLRRAIRGQGRKGSGLGVKEGSEEAKNGRKGRIWVFYRKWKNCQCKSTSKAQGHWPL